MAEDDIDYGVDAPGVMLGLGLGGLAGTAAGAVALARGGGALRVAGGIVAVGALVPLGLGLAMGAYATGGKARLRDWLLARHAWRGDETVLDVGAGRGLMAIGAASRVPQGQVIALDLWRAGDLSGNGAEALAANAERAGVARRIEVVTGDARAVPLADASIDLVLSVLCLHNIEPAADRARACREIARVLRPGGRALIADYVGTKDYARAFQAAGLEVRGPIGAKAVARSLMALVEAEKPTR